MSALIETMFYVGAMPWHGEGQKLSQPPTSAEAIMQAGLDWEISTQPIFRIRGDSPGDLEPRVYARVPEGQVVIRETDKKVLGVVGSRWTPVQNRDAFNFFDPLVQDGYATYHTAGSLREGRTVWVLAQIGENRFIVGDDAIGQFLLLSMGHDGTRGVQLMPTPIRVVCANTLNAAEQTSDEGKTMLKFAHTTNVVKRLRETQEFIRPFLHNFEETTEVFRTLARSQVSDKAAEAYLETLFPNPKGENASITRAENVRKTIMQKFEGDLLGYDAIPSHFQQTYWTLYNAVTEYIDHNRGSDKHRLNSCWLGSGAKVKERALELATVAM